MGFTTSTHTRLQQRTEHLVQRRFVIRYSYDSTTRQFHFDHRAAHDRQWHRQRTPLVGQCGDFVASLRRQSSSRQGEGILQRSGSDMEVSHTRSRFLLLKPPLFQLLRRMPLRHQATWGEPEKNTETCSTRFTVELLISCMTSHLLKLVALTGAEWQLTGAEWQLTVYCRTPE